jgi:hypothetical protein
VLACFGNCLYWTACATSLLWVFLVLFASANAAYPGWTIFAPIAIFGAIIIWCLGRAARYLLVGR